MVLSHSSIYSIWFESDILQVVLDYQRFEPKGRAYLSLMRPDYMGQAIAAFRNASISSIPIRAFPSPAYIAPQRGRGVEGRERAAERGVLQGNGPRAGLGVSGRNVVLWGLPGKLTQEGLRSMMVAWELAASSGTAGLEILKIVKCVDPFIFKRAPYQAQKSVNRPPTKFSLYSRFIVRTQSAAEAHRIVRQLHMTHFHPNVYQDRYLMKARVIY